MKAEQALLPEHRGEKELQRRGHQYGNGIRSRQSAVREGSQMFAHLYDLPVNHVEIFSVLHKKKIAIGKTLRNAAVWWVHFSGYKCKKLKA
ncbi:MAG: hypothetical protein WDM78_01130 [Puia sp.]